MKSIRYLFFVLGIFISSVFFTVYAQENKAALEAELKILQQELDSYNTKVKQKTAEAGSLKKAIEDLTKKIKNMESQIKTSEKIIQSLSYSISDKNHKIKILEDKILENKENIASVLVEMEYYKNNDTDLFLFTKDSLSDIVDGYYKKQYLQDSLAQILKEFEANKNFLENTKASLEQDKKEELLNKNKQLILKKEVEGNKTEKDKILTITKGEEKKYQSLLSETQKKIASIRAKLFNLRDSGAISFGQAYDYAVLASKTTGVRPALILAILQQESALGANVGQCYVTDDISGVGIKKNGVVMSSVMNPTRDIPKFKLIASALGFDYKTQVVSCPIPSAGGWGGAMGPSQFIPSTWYSYKDKIAAATGSDYANPWSAYHAITATSIYLQDLGAVAYNENSEKNAACKYYSGRSCSASSAGNGYGASVMKRVKSVQSDIDTIK